MFPPIEEVLSCFGKLLEERFMAVAPTSEDSIRYSFFLALVQTGFCIHSDVWLELPHPTISGAEIDLLVRAVPGRQSAAFEFKYDRAIPSQRNLPRTQKAGAVFKDLFRLAHIPENITNVRYFIYCTSEEMASYLRNPTNGWTRFWSLRKNEQYDLTINSVQSQSATFRGVIGNLFIPCKVTGLFVSDLPSGHCLRAYQVSPS